ncbi:hypothetical protein ACU6QH_00280, partial [Aeromonas veronii]|uniref:hypothetical protein n=1 Tax=Aeromonas veronii TaxID=654 RepID=UPI00406C6A9E
MMVGNKATAGTITVNTGGKLDVFAEGVAENVLLQEGGRASTAGHIGIATIGKGGLLDVYG